MPLRRVVDPPPAPRPPPPSSCSNHSLNISGRILGNERIKCNPGVGGQDMMEKVALGRGEAPGEQECPPLPSLPGTKLLNENSVSFRKDVASAGRGAEAFAEATLPQGGTAASGQCWGTGALAVHPEHPSPPSPTAPTPAGPKHGAFPQEVFTSRSGPGVNGCVCHRAGAAARPGIS